jgi:hypothetical protein
MPKNHKYELLKYTRKFSKTMLWSRFLSFDFSLSTNFLTIHTCHWTKMTAIVHTCHWSKMTSIVHACHWSKMTATVHTCHWTKMTAISIYNTFLPIDLASTSYPYMYVYVNCRKLFQTIYTGSHLGSMTSVYCQKVSWEREIKG